MSDTVKEFNDSLYGVEVKLGGQLFTLRDWFEVTLEDLSYEYANQASKLAYLGVLEAQAEAAHLAAKVDREREYAKAQVYFRTKGNIPDDLKVTESTVDAFCKLDANYKDAQQAEVGTLRKLKIIRNLTHAMRQRGEMLISLGATQRAEYDQTAMHVNRLRSTLRDATEEAGDELS